MADATPTTSNSTANAGTASTSGTTASKGATGQVRPATEVPADAAATGSVYGELTVESPTTSTAVDQSEAVKAAAEAAREEEAARTENPNKVVYRTVEDSDFFRVGHVVGEDNA